MIARVLKFQGFCEVLLRCPMYWRILILQRRDWFIFHFTGYTHFDWLGVHGESDCVFLSRSLVQ